MNAKRKGVSPALGLLTPQISVELSSGLLINILGLKMKSHLYPGVCW